MTTATTQAPRPLNPRRTNAASQAGAGQGNAAVQGSPARGRSGRGGSAAARGSVPHRGEGGSARTIELVITLPLVMTVMLLVLQYALWAHAATCAHAAATAAIEAARVDGGSAAAGRASATNTLRQLAAGVLRRPTVMVARDAATARATITGTATRVIPLPGLNPAVRVQVAAPIDRWVPPGRSR